MDLLQINKKGFISEYMNVNNYIRYVIMSPSSYFSCLCYPVQVVSHLVFQSQPPLNFLWSSTEQFSIKPSKYFLPCLNVEKFTLNQESINWKHHQDLRPTSLFLHISSLNRLAKMHTHKLFSWRFLKICLNQTICALFSICQNCKVNL